MDHNEEPHNDEEPYNDDESHGDEESHDDEESHNDDPSGMPMDNFFVITPSNLNVLLRLFVNL